MVAAARDPSVGQMLFLTLVFATAISEPGSGWSQRAQLLRQRQQQAIANGVAPPQQRLPLGAHDYAATRGQRGDAQKWRATPGWSLPREVVSQLRPEQYLRDSDVPTEWDWRHVSLAPSVVVSFVTRVRNQFLPHWCGSCWAHAAAAVVGSRWQIHGATSASPDFSVQHLINCVTEGDPIKFPESMKRSEGCDGGSSYGAFAFSHQVGVVDSSCLPYTAETEECNAAGTCLQHLSATGKPKPVAPTRHRAAEFGYLRNETAILKEVFARGPVSCCMACPEEFEEYTSGIFSTTSDSSNMCDHLVTVVGFGGEGDSAHYVVQNR